MTKLPEPYPKGILLFRWTAVAVFLGGAFFFPTDYGLLPQASGPLRLRAATPDRMSGTGDAINLTCGDCLERLGVAAWHRAGDRGRGVKVLILDSGFSGYCRHLGHALPERVTVKSFRGDGNLEAKASQHGILCGEVVHTLAPEAELLFANWEPDRPDQFLEAVRWAKQQGAQIVTCSVIMPSWSDGEGGGGVHCELAQILGSGGHSGDMMFFASAGNTAQRHWSGRFAPSSHDGRNGYHEWTPGCQDDAIEPWGGEMVSVELCCAVGCKLELSVYDVTAGEAVGTSVASASNEHGCAVVHFLPRDHHSYTARVRGRDTAGTFHLVVLGGGLQVANAAGSVAFPADGAEVVAVGAVDPGGQRTAYSSCGPNSTCPKPDLVAAVPFPSGWRGRPFSGTSAASPQAEALAALVWTRHPDWTARRVRDELCSDAEQLANGAPNFETGYGRIHLP
jgi:subtilisin family serine protease